MTELSRLTTADIKKGGAPIVALTSYTAQVARVVDRHADFILVGDSLGMVIYGFTDTLNVTLDMMIAHGAAVVRSTQRALIVVDMPYGSYEDSADDALKNARRVMAETGCGAVKLEGGQDMAATVKHLVDNGVPVCGHVGLMPQSIEKMGGFKIQGKDEASAAKVKADAIAIAKAGAFAIVIEGTVEPVARDITVNVNVPTIGIGASAECDGQILVINDVLGLTPKVPRFVKRYADLAAAIDLAAGSFAQDVRGRSFPAVEHTFKAAS